MAKTDPNRGRCIGCAYLIIRTNPYEKGEHRWEIEQERREIGNIFHMHDKEMGKRNAEPMCLRGLMSFKDEIDGNLWGGRHTSGNDEIRNDALRVINVDRHCKTWWKYQPGLSPSSLLELSMIASLEKNRRKWERRMERERRAYEDQAEQNRHTEEKSRRRFEKKLTIWLAIIASLIAAVDIIVNVIIAFVQSGD